MPWFRVMLKGAPVFLRDVDSHVTKCLGFYTTRWVRAPARRDAGRVACRLVRDELDTWGPRNPPDQPMRVAAEDIVPVSWFEGLRSGPGRGFTFYPAEGGPTP
jgi:hypothetical protein